MVPVASTYGIVKNNPRPLALLMALLGIVPVPSTYGLRITPSPSSSYGTARNSPRPPLLMALLRITPSPSSSYGTALLGIIPAPLYLRHCQE
jgi:hypothetical protein